MMLLRVVLKGPPSLLTIDIASERSMVKEERAV